MPPLPLKIAVLLYPGVDILDFSGPIEIYTTSPRPSPHTPIGTPPPPNFHITTFASTSPVPAAQSALVYQPHANFETVAENLQDYDVLLLPGAHPDVLVPLLASEEGQQMIQLVQRFASLSPRSVGDKGDERRARIMQSVCTGALILGAAGVLAGKRATTHHLAFDLLQELADGVVSPRKGSERAVHGVSGIDIVEERWVDAGLTGGGTRIVTAGGVSSGIDSALAVVEMFFGKEEAEWVGEVVEFERRGDGWRVGESMEGK